MGTMGVVSSAWMSTFESGAGHPLLSTKSKKGIAMLSTSLLELAQYVKQIRYAGVQSNNVEMNSVWSWFMYCLSKTLRLAPLASV